MKKNRVIMVGVLVFIFVLTMLLLACKRNSLENTVWEYQSSTRMITISFGKTDYTYNRQTIRNDGDISDTSTKGTYKIEGDKVITTQVKKDGEVGSITEYELRGNTLVNPSNSYIFKKIE